MAPLNDYGFIMTSMGTIYILKCSLSGSLSKFHQDNKLLAQNNPIIDFILTNGHQNIIAISKTFAFLIDTKNKENPEILKQISLENGANFQSVCQGVDLLDKDNVRQIYFGVSKGIVVYRLNFTDNSLKFLQSFLNQKLISDKIIDIRRDPIQKFIFLSIDKVGLLIYDISDLNNIKQASQQIGYEVQFRTMRINEPKKLIILTHYMRGFEIWDYSALYNSPYPATITRKTFYPLPSAQIDHFAVTSDLQKLILFSYSFGIYIFNLTKLEDISVNQIINSNDIGVTLFLTENQDRLYILQQNSLDMYSRLLKIDPFTINHALNFHQNDFYKINNSIPFSFSYKNSQKRLYTAFGTGGFVVFDVSDPLQLKKILHITPEGLCGKKISVDGVRLFRESNNLCLVLQSSEGIHLYNLEDINNPISISTLQVEGDMNSIIEFETFKRIFAVAAGFQGMYIVNFTDLLNPFIVSHAPALKSFQSKIDVSEDDRFIFCVEIFTGLSIYDVSDLKNPKLIKVYYNYGASDVEFSKKYPGHLYLSAGNEQLKILKLDYSSLTFTEVSSLQYGFGWSQNVAINYPDETFAYLAQIESNSLIIIDISDIYNPFIVSILNSFNYQMNSITIANSKTCYLGEQNGVIAFPLMSSGMGYFTVSERIKNTDTIIEPISGTYQFEVGQKVEIRLTNFINPQNKIIKNVYQYINYQQLAPLPSYMSFEDNVLYIEFQKENVGGKENTGKVEIVFEILSKIQIQDCTNSGRTIDQCNILFDQLLYNFIINEFYYPITDSQYFQYQDILGSYIPDKDNSRFIRQLLLKKFNSILFLVNVKSSLQFSIGNEVNPIRSRSENIEITLQVYQLASDVQPGKFEKKQVQGIILELSDKQDKIIITGSLQSVNQNLKQIVFIENKSFQRSQVSVNITVKDFLNPIIKKNGERLDQLKFIMEPVQKFELKQKIQDIFNENFPNGEVFIEEDFAFQITVEKIYLYYKPFFQNIAIKAFQIDPISQKPIPLLKTQWVDFQETTQTLYGKPKQTHFRQKITLQLVATDGGYSEQVIDTLEITANRIPASVILTYLGLIGSPLVTIIGLIKYRITIYNMCKKEKFNKQREEFAFINQPYFKTINLIEPNYTKMIEIYEKIKIIKQFDQKSFFEKNGQFKSSEFKDFIEKNQVDIFLKNLNYTFDSIKKKDSQLFQMICLYAIIKKMESDKQLTKIYEKLKQFSQNGNKNDNHWYLKYFEIQHVDYKELLADSNQFPVCSVKLNYILSLIQRALTTIEDQKVKKNKKIETQKVEQNISDFNQQNHASSSDDFSDPKTFEDRFPDLQYWIIIKAVEAEILGVHGYNRMQFSMGETICFSADEIKEIGAYKESSSRILQMLRCINLNYQQIGMNENEKLPLWLNCELKQNCLYLRGVPKEQDQDTIFIRIIALDDMNLLQFHLNVEFQHQQHQLQQISTAQNLNSLDTSNIQENLIMDRFPDQNIENNNNQHKTIDLMRSNSNKIQLNIEMNPINKQQL